ncbi:MAG: tRNA (adenosine(37)-N6)-threonylcarbamoyltransferase complex dimerization subunit type 1 TsaB [Gemmataceae bacterium]|nr:tRNA (adenosine(37)-N6)-threonylcarbamoyltransferase complex dimerization subunit type 1 TsaB [Gemmataceae bacterium]
MTTPSEPRLLILETSLPAAQVALAQGSRLLGVRRLDEARRQARDLAPAVRELLNEQGWRPRDLHAVLVSRGPGSYTGLRVGVMSAKALAYATGCALLAVDTFAAIASQAPDDVLSLHVLADAQQDKIYIQWFRRDTPGADFTPAFPLTIQPVDEWLPWLGEGACVSGPGLRKYADQLSHLVRLVEEDRREPQPEALLRLGLARYLRGQRDDMWAVEPLYLRPSSAEEQWAKMGK